jgi:hypothetical protein
MSKYVRLIDCLPGMFLFENRWYLRTEYGEAYDCRDGSNFWVRPDLCVGSREMDDLMKDRSDIMVCPVMKLGVTGVPADTQKPAQS